MEYNIPLAEFVNTLFPDLSDNETICLAKPNSAGTFSHYPATERKLARIEKKPDEYYLCLSTVVQAEKLRRRKSDCICAYLIMLDDIGTKAAAPHLEPSAILETSENNYQYLYFIDPFELSGPEEIAYFEACHRAIIEAGYCDKGAQGVNRVFRLPGSINKKETANKWQTRIVHWQPENFWPLNDLMNQLGLKPAYKSQADVDYAQYEGELPAGFNDPVLEWLAENGMLGDPGPDFYAIKCPWADQHTTGKDSAGYSPLGHGSPKLLRGFNCFHAHCQHQSTADFLAWVQEKGGPGVHVSGIHEIEAEVLKRETRELSASERVTVLYASLPAVWKKMLPDLSFTAMGTVSGAQKPTRPNIQYVIDTLGVDLRMNMQDHKTEFTFNSAINELIDHEDEAIRCVLDTAQKVGMGSVLTEFQRVTSEIGMNRRYHPMAEWVASKPWDGKKRFNDILTAVNVDKEYAQHWKIYLRRWLIQTIQAVFGWKNPQQMRGCIVIAGPQNIGKSTFFGSLVPPQFFKEGAHIELHGSKSTDSIMQNTAFPIVELGELETTFSKSAAGQLKAFMALKKDTYRSPYDVRARDWPRCTSFCGTVNKMDFLVDETGSSRFWPVHAETVNPQHGVDVQQLWAEVHSWWKKGEQWWLTQQEEAMRIDMEENFEVSTDVKELTMEWLCMHKWPGTGMNATAFATLIGVPSNRPNLSLIRNLLTRHLGKPRMVKGARNGWDVPTLPGENAKFKNLKTPA